METGGVGEERVLGGERGEVGEEGVGYGLGGGMGGVDGADGGGGREGVGVVFEVSAAGQSLDEADVRRGDVVSVAYWRS